MHDEVVRLPTPQRAEGLLRTAGHVVSAQQENATILLDVRGGKYYTLNGVGACIWSLLSDGATVSAIIQRLADEFEVSTEQLSRDVPKFVEQLQDSKLITG
jgi:hypothetical protein